MKIILFTLKRLIVFGIIRKAAAKAKGITLKRLSLSMCLMSSFSGGVLLTTCILNMIPEIQKCVKFVEMEEIKMPMIKENEETNCKPVKVENDMTLMKKKSTLKQPVASHEAANALEAPFKRHAHSHLIRSVVMFYSLALHSYMEGLSYGLRKEKRVLINIFLVTITHQCVLAFAFGVQLWRTHWLHKKFVVVAIVALSLATPLGALSGLGLGKTSNFESIKETLLLIFESFASGSLLYVIFFEIMENQRNNEHSDFLKLFSMIPGFLLVASITLAHLTETKAGNEVHDLHRRQFEG